MSFIKFQQSDFDAQKFYGYSRFVFENEQPQPHEIVSIVTRSVHALEMPKVAFDEESKFSAQKVQTQNALHEARLRIIAFRKNPEDKSMDGYISQLDALQERINKAVATFQEKMGSVRTQADKDKASALGEILQPADLPPAFSRMEDLIKVLARAIAAAKESSIIEAYGKNFESLGLLRAIVARILPDISSQDRKDYDAKLASLTARLDKIMEYNNASRRAYNVYQNKKQKVIEALTSRSADKPAPQKDILVLDVPSENPDVKAQLAALSSDAEMKKMHESFAEFLQQFNAIRQKKSGERNASELNQLITSFNTLAERAQGKNVEFENKAYVIIAQLYVYTKSYPQAQQYIDKANAFVEKSSEEEFKKNFDLLKKEVEKNIAKMTPVSNTPIAEPPDDEKKKAQDKDVTPPVNKTKDDEAKIAAQKAAEEKARQQAEAERVAAKEAADKAAAEKQKNDKIFQENANRFIDAIDIELKKIVTEHLAKAPEKAGWDVSDRKLTNEFNAKISQKFSSEYGANKNVAVFVNERKDDIVAFVVNPESARRFARAIFSSVNSEMKTAYRATVEQIDQWKTEQGRKDLQQHLEAVSKKLLEDTDEKLGAYPASLQTDAQKKAYREKIQALAQSLTSLGQRYAAPNSQMKFQDVVSENILGVGQDEFLLDPKGPSIVTKIVARLEERAAKEVIGGAKIEPPKVPKTEPPVPQPKPAEPKPPEAPQPEPTAKPPEPPKPVSPPESKPSGATLPGIEASESELKKQAEAYYQELNKIHTEMVQNLRDPKMVLSAYLKNASVFEEFLKKLKDKLTQYENRNLSDPSVQNEITMYANETDSAKRNLYLRKYIGKLFQSIYTEYQNKYTEALVKKYGRFLDEAAAGQQKAIESMKLISSDSEARMYGFLNVAGVNILINGLRGKVATILDLQSSLNNSSFDPESTPIVQGDPTSTFHKLFHIDSPANLPTLRQQSERDVEEYRRKPPQENVFVPQMTDVQAKALVNLLVDGKRASAPPVQPEIKLPEPPKSVPPEGSDLQSQITKLEGTVKEQAAEIDELKKELAAKNRELDTAKADLVKARKEAAELKKQTQPPVPPAPVAGAAERPPEKTSDAKEKEIETFKALVNAQSREFSIVCDELDGMTSEEVDKRIKANKNFDVTAEIKQRNDAIRQLFTKFDRELLPKAKELHLDVQEQFILVRMANMQLRLGNLRRALDLMGLVNAMAATYDKQSQRVQKYIQETNGEIAKHWEDKEKE
jgi:hypothetical protein